MHYYQFNIADYRKDTYPLTPVQHMMYRWLIDEYYLTEQPFKNDMIKLLWRMGMGDEYRSDLELILENFFEPAQDDDFKAPNLSEHPEIADIGDNPELCQYWIHPRIERDIAEYKELLNKKAKAGKASGKSRKQKLNTCSTDDEQNGNCVEQTINHKPITINQEPDNTMSSQSDNPSQKVPFKKIIDLYHTILPDLPRCEILNKTREGYIRQRWQDKDHGLPTLTHWENYFLHVSRSRFLMGKTEPINGRPPFRANLEWLTKLSNYTKVYEDKYHE